MKKRRIMLLILGLAGFLLANLLAHFLHVERLRLLHGRQPASSGDVRRARSAVGCETGVRAGAPNDTPARIAGGERFIDGLRKAGVPEQ